MKKQHLLSILFFAWSVSTFACEVCERNQPEPLKGITHGVGPTGNIDYIIIGVASVIVGISLFLSIKYLVRPKEHEAGHIKNIVLDEN